MDPAAAASAAEVVCVLTGDRLFSRAAPHKLLENGIAYRVTGDMAEGLLRLAEKNYVPPEDTDGWPLDAIDIVRWADLRQVRLERSEFMARWRRYVQALVKHLLATPAAEGGGEDAADAFLLASHDLAMKLLWTNYDELDFLIGASEQPVGPFAVLEYLDEDPLTPTLLFLTAGCREVPRAG